jgi:hypothetical protein
MIVVNTVGYDSDATDYWDGIEADTYHDEFFDEMDERYVFDGTLQQCLEACDYDSFIVGTDHYRYSDADYTVSVYDGYNE